MLGDLVGFIGLGEGNCWSIEVRRYTDSSDALDF